MKKSGKKLLTQILTALTAAFFLPLLPVTVSADETERVALHVQTPEDWGAPCIWAWSEDGTNAFEAWPGEELLTDGENDGWYYLWVPDFANHVIVNGNAGEVQTEEIVLEEKTESWITVDADGSFTVSTDALTSGETPEYVERFAVHARVDESWEEPCLWAWSAPDGTNVFDAWPGEELTLDEASGWYTAKVPVWVNSIIVNGNGGEVQTEDLSIDPAEVWVTVDADGGADFSYVDPDKAAVANVHIYAKAPADWEAPCLWAWSAPDGTNVFANWPGEAFEEGTDGWLVKEVPGWVNSVIVNGNDGAVQTSDISIETEKDVWLVVSGPEEYEVYYEEPEIVETVEAAEETTETVAEPETEAVTEAEAGSGSKAVPIAVGCVAAGAAAVGGAAAYHKKKKAA